MIDFDQLPHFKKFQIQILDMIPQWEQTYQVDADAVEKQIREAHAWILTNPKKAPRERILRFLNSWMSSARRYHNLGRKEYLPPPPPPMPEGDMTIEEMVAIRKKNMGQRFS